MLAREAYCPKAYLGMASAFICCLKLGPAPMNPNALDDTPVEVLGRVVATAGPGAAPPLTTAVNAAVRLVAQRAPPAAGAYATIKQQLPPAFSLFIDAEPSIDTITRQTAAGYRVSGPLMAGLSGGGAEGIDLLPQARRDLLAQQVPTGILASGPLVTTPPAGVLPPVSSYAPFLYGTGSPKAGVAPPPPIGPPPLSPLLCTTAQTPIVGLGGGGGVGSGMDAPAPRRMEPAYVSDELHIQYLTGMLGSFSP
jgi:hypothetical protein